MSIPPVGNYSNRSIVFKMSKATCASMALPMRQISKLLVSGATETGFEPDTVSDYSNLLQAFCDPLNNGLKTGVLVLPASGYDTVSVISILSSDAAQLNIVNTLTLNLKNVVQYDVPTSLFKPIALVQLPSVDTTAAISLLSSNCFRADTYFNIW